MIYFNNRISTYLIDVEKKYELIGYFALKLKFYCIYKWFIFYYGIISYLIQIPNALNDAVLI